MFDLQPVSKVIHDGSQTGERQDRDQSKRKLLEKKNDY